MARNYAAVFHEYLEEMAELDDAEFGRLIRALLKFSATGEVVELSGNERFYYRRVIMQERRCQNSYESLTARNRENGKKGGRPKNPEEPNETQKSEIKTETETKTKTKSKSSSYAPRSTDRRSAAAASAAQAERMRRDMAEMAKLTEGGGAR